MIVNVFEEGKKVQERLTTSEEMLGKGLTQPFNYSNSGARKILYGLHREQSLPLLNPEVPIIQTGFENEFGKYSSSFIETDVKYEVIGKINKYSTKPNFHYWLLLFDYENKKFDIIERVEFKHITEVYGYKFDNTTLDRLEVGDIVDAGTVIKKSLSFDEYNNRMDGINLTTAYLSCDETMEDSIIVSSAIVDRLDVALFKVVQIVVNDNDILLNLYGSDTTYKTFPDIGEEIQNGLLCAIRREKKEDALFTQSFNRLKDILMSDEKYTLRDGQIVDINVFCNNIENLEGSYYNGQVKYYHDEHINFCKNVVLAVEKAILDYGNHELSYELQRMLYTCQSILDGKQYIKDRPFSNVLMEIVIMEVNKLSVGDKLSNRYGGKGVISEIRDESLMPLLDNGKRVELIYNKSTYLNRMNPGQMFEMSLTHVASRIIDLFQMDPNPFDCSQLFEMFYEYLKILNPEQAEMMMDTFSGSSDYELLDFIQSIINSGAIMVSLKPMSDIITIDTIKKLYDEFPWAKQYQLSVPITDSNNNIRFVESKRPIVCGKMYMYRLKQYAEEKFSVTSLSSTNLRNENSRNRSNKMYKSLFTNTPIRLGEMETNNLTHMGTELVVVNLMLHSTSPDARRKTEALLTGSPYEVDVRLDDTSSSRSAETLNVLFKTAGLMFEFIKKAKKLKRPILKIPFEYLVEKRKLTKPMTFLHEAECDDPEYQAKAMAAITRDGKLKPFLKIPIEYIK